NSSPGVSLQLTLKGTARIRANLPILDQNNNKIDSVIITVLPAKAPDTHHCCIDIPPAVWSVQGGFKQVSLAFVMTRCENAWRATFSALHQPKNASNSSSEFERIFRYNEYRIHKRASELGCAPPLLAYTKDLSKVYITFCWDGDLTHRSFAQHVPFIGQEMTNILALLHANGIRHQDIKPDNMLCHANKLYVTDFGGAIDQHTPSELKGFVGTRRYCSPAKQLIFLTQRYRDYIRQQWDAMRQEYLEILEAIQSKAKIVDERHGSRQFTTHFENWADPNDQEKIVGSMQAFFGTAYQTFKQECQLTDEQRVQADVRALALSLRDINRSNEDLGFAIPAECTQCRGCENCTKMSMIPSFQEKIDQCYKETNPGSVDWIIGQMLRLNPISAKEAHEMFMDDPSSVEEDL
ncbi:MAG: hypothetical protein KGQ49_03670, partial [Verrucomicrobia bacterium]|nr:hypothetical protein [Verrucomicrobiota bacterium]